jgi:hypothetical protein
MAKRLPKPTKTVGYRLDWDKHKAADMDAAAAYVGLSVASFTRLALELLITRRRVTLDEVRAEAARLTAEAAQVTAKGPEKG